MNELLTKLEDTINDRAVRERALLGLISLFLVYTLWNLVLFTPLQVKATRIKNDQKFAQAQKQTFQVEIQTILKRAAEDPNAEGREEQEEKTSTLQSLDQQLEIYAPHILSSRKVLSLLREMLLQNKDLELIRIASSKPTPLTQFNGVALASHSLFKKPIIIQFKGSYFSTLNYLHTLEGLHWRLFWEDLTYKVETYPTANVTLTVFTLSRSQ